jgi:hypothetical protein
MGFKEFIKRRSLKAKDSKRTNAAELSLRESIYPIALVTILFFLWGFSYGLLDTLNVSVLDTVDFISVIWGKREANGPLSTIPCKRILAYQIIAETFPEYLKHHKGEISWSPRSIFRVRVCLKKSTAKNCSQTDVANLSSAYPLASLGHANWILRHYGYRATFIWGLCLYGMWRLIIAVFYQ